MSASVGLYLNPRTPGPESDVRVVREVVSQIELADRLGFEAVWLTEHAFSGQSAYSDPIPLAAYLAGRVRMRTIGFAVAVLPTHNPVRFATQCAEIDALSDGRLVVGIGTGLGIGEYQGYGAAWEGRVAATDEALELVKDLWRAEGPFEAHGERFAVSTPGRIIPRVVQQPYPLIVQATASETRLAALGRAGDGALLGAHSPAFLRDRQIGPLVAGFAEGGIPADRQKWILDRCGVLHQVYVRADDEDPGGIEPYLEAFKQTNGSNRFRTDEFGPKANRGKTLSGGPPPGISFSQEDSLDHLRHQFTIGTADEVFERLAPQITEGGVHHLMVWANWAVMPDAMVQASIRRFGERVLPRLAALTPATVTPPAVALAD